MRAFSSCEHLAAIIVGLLLVLGLRIQDRPIPIIAGWVGASGAVVYSKYFPGLNRLEQHEIFSPENRDVKKIVFLGASAVHSVGCDCTWIPPTQSIRQSANVHYSCSVAEQFNDELARRGIKGWKAFNLAKAGGRLMPMMYVYARLLPLKPELVVYGDSFPYYMMSNAGAESLLSDDHSFLRKTFNEHAATRALWGRFEEHLRANGLSATPLLSPRNIAKSFLRLQPDSSASGAIGNLFTGPRNLYTELQQPLPVRYTMFRRWEASQSPLARFDNPDPGFRYFEGVRLMSEMQKLNGGKLFFYYSPQFDHRDDVAYNQGLNREFGGYMNDNGIAHTSLVSLPLEPVTETYDGDHQTVYGNRRIALAVLDQLQAQGLVK
jgi:hypothetical protein